MRPGKEKKRKKKEKKPLPPLLENEKRAQGGGRKFSLGSERGKRSLAVEGGGHRKGKKKKGSPFFSFLKRGKKKERSRPYLWKKISKRRVQVRINVQMAKERKKEEKKVSSRPPRSSKKLVLKEGLKHALNASGRGERGKRKKKKGVFLMSCPVGGGKVDIKKGRVIVHSLGRRKKRKGKR